MLRAQVDLGRVRRRDSPQRRPDRAIHYTAQRLRGIHEDSRRPHLSLSQEEERRKNSIQPSVRYRSGTQLRPHWTVLAVPYARAQPCPAFVYAVLLSPEADDIGFLPAQATLCLPGGGAGAFFSSLHHHRDGQLRPVLLLPQFLRGTTRHTDTASQSGPSPFCERRFRPLGTHYVRAKA